MIQVLEGRDVDTIEPFPAREIQAAVGWTHCNKTLMFGPNGPETDDQIEGYLRNLLSQPNVRSWGIIDKANLTKAKKLDTPVIGFIVAEFIGPNNAYIHVASNRRAWGSKLAQPSLTAQAGHLVIAHLFNTVSDLTRLSVTTLASNKAARHLAEQVGFKKDGYFISMIVGPRGPMDVIHMGLVREQPTAVATEA